MATTAKQKQAAKSRYTWFHGSLQLRPDPPRVGFKLPYNIVLESNIDQVIAEIKQAKAISLDTETTSLDPDIAQLCCASFCYGGTAYTAYAKHSTETAVLPRHQFVRLMQAISEVPFVFFFHFNYDYRILRNQIPEVDWRPMGQLRSYDVQGLVYLSDTNIWDWRLKTAARFFLGVDPPEFDEEALGEAIFLKDINELTYYASFDAWDTYHLAMKFYPEMKQRYSFILKLDAKLLLPLAEFEEGELPVNWEIMKAYGEQIQNKIQITQQEFFGKFGPMNMNSGPQKIELLRRLGFDTGEKTETGLMKVGIKQLEKIKDRCEAAALLINHSRLTKVYSSYVSPMLERHYGGLPIRFKYRGYRVPTYRMAAGSYIINKKKKYKNTGPWVAVNIQSGPKPKQVERLCDFDPQTFKFNFHEGGHWLVETAAPDLTFRRAFEVADDEVWIATDFSGQEIVIAGNESGDELLLSALEEGRDLHKEMAIRIWGEENYDKNKRKMAKAAVFGCPTKDVLLNTQRGLVSPQALRPDDRIYDRHGNLQTWQCALQEDQDCLELEFSSGLIETYHVDHQFLCFTPERSLEWVKARDLSPAHEIVHQPGGFGSIATVAQKVHFPATRKGSVPFLWDTGDVRVAYLLGLLVSSGWVCLSAPYANVSVAHTLVDHVKQLLSLLGVSHTVKSRSPSHTALRLIGKGFCSMLQELVPDHIPDNRLFELLPTSALEYFLAGVFDGKRSSSSTRKTYVLETFQSRQLSAVARAASMLGGVSTRIKASHTPRGTTLYRLSVFLPRELPCKLASNLVGETLYRSDEGFRNVPHGLFQRRLDPVSGEGPSRGYLRSTPALLAGKQKAVTQRALDELGPLFSKEFSLARNSSCVRVLYATPKKDTIYVLQTENREYLSSNLVSHNCMYGGTEYTLMQNLGITEAQATFIVKQMKAALPGLFRWIETQHMKARTTGEIINAYGLPRRLRPYYLMGGSWRGYADRSSVNTAIQSCGSVIIRMVLVKLWELLNSKYGGVVNITNNDGSFVNMTSQAMFLATIHDEVNIRCKRARLLEFLTDLDNLMISANHPKWRVKAGVEHSIGSNWAEVVPIKLFKDASGSVVSIEPKGERVDPSQRRDEKAVAPEKEEVEEFFDSDFDEEEF